MAGRRSTEMEGVRLENAWWDILSHPPRNHIMMTTPLPAGETVETKTQTITM